MKKKPMVLHYRLVRNKRGEPMESSGPQKANADGSRKTCQGQRSKSWER